MLQKDLFNNVSSLKKPFLRWTGGKNWLIPELMKIISKVEFNNYYEPFLGGGSVFFALNTDQKSFLSDFNHELINAYSQVKNNPELVINYLKDFPQNKEFYYDLRERELSNGIINAAKFIYLNKTSFNGIYRVNRNGKYNVPYGKRTFNIEIISESIYSCSNQLQNAYLESMDFNDSLSRIKKNDLVYLDPPYTITHNNNGFVEYNEKIFSIIDQNRLSETIKKIKDKKAYYILSNAYHPIVKDIYDIFGDKVLTLSRRSIMSGKTATKSSYKEYLFTNIP
ncbi:Dam family site-specific DNA-(adenine-N6)-methyltransferase [Flavobacteriaceae bacterium]|nr:Dam family site-specific DNA-(adenine-N6)-methyltransferase [Flavobacteriaceae bacterium]